MLLWVIRLRVRGGSVSWFVCEGARENFTGSRKVFASGGGGDGEKKDVSVDNIFFLIWF